MRAWTWREAARWRWVKARRAWCRFAHSWRLWVPTNGLGWTGSRCTRCGYSYFERWEGVGIPRTRPVKPGDPSPPAPKKK